MGDLKERTCYICGETHPLTREHFKPTQNGNFTQKCKKCIYKERLAKEREIAKETNRVCPACEKTKKGKDFPKGGGKRVCFDCDPKGKPTKKFSEGYQPIKNMTEEELEARYQHLLQDTDDVGLKTKPMNINIGAKVYIKKATSERKDNFTEVLRGCVVGKTDEFIIIECKNYKECFQLVDFAINDYKIKECK